MRHNLQFVNGREIRAGSSCVGCHARAVDEVRRRDDDELCGHIDHRDGRWCALAVFGAVLGRHDSREAATQQLLDEGLASLAERWTLRNGENGEEEVVCIQRGERGRRDGCPWVLLDAGRADPDDHSTTDRRW